MNPIEQSLLERIDAYLMDKMSPQERSQFEAELEARPELRKLLAEQQDIHDAIGYREVGKTLRKLGTQPAPLRTSRTRVITWIALAASVLIVVAMIFLLPARQPEHIRLYSEYYTPDPGLPTLMGEAERDYVFMQGMVAFKSGDFADALSQWQSLSAGERYRDTLPFYTGLAHMGLDEFDAARQHLERTSPDGAFAEKRQWYLALILIHEEELDAARALLRTLSDRPGRFQAQAGELLRRMQE